MSLAGKRVAVLVEEEFEDRELTGPVAALRDAGATVVIVGPTAGMTFTGKRGEATVTSDLAAGAARMIASLNAGTSSGLREVMRLPSSTTGLST